MTELLDLEHPDFLILSDKRAYLEDEYRVRYEREAIAAAWEVIGRAEEIQNAWWFSEKWLEDTIRNASEAFDRWGELY